MKKLLALALALLMCMAVFSGCGARDDEDKGAIINAYVAYVPYDLDPGKTYYDANVEKYFTLIYEGLTRYDENGKLQKVLAKEWEYGVDERDGKLKLNVEIAENYWSDGIQVDAEDFVYAWKRLLLPENVNSNASLLFAVENARKAKNGEVSIDDVGIRAVGDYDLQIVFESVDADVEYFLNATASPALLPVREDIAAKSPELWATDAATMLTNGPFKIKSWGTKEIVLERSGFYGGLHLRSNPDPWKYVTPYRIVVSASNDREEMQALIKANELFYAGEFTAESFAAAKSVKTTDIPSAYSYLLNQNNELFKDADVRKALSMVIDREELASVVGLDVKPATGIVPTAVKNGESSKSFRKAGGNLIATKADVEGAKALLSGKTGEIEIKYLKRNGDDGFEKDVAQYVKSCWEQLGFTVTLQPVKAKFFQETIAAGDFDVLAMDLCALTTDASTMLVPFASTASGNVVDVLSHVAPVPYFNGYEDEAYNAIVETFLASTTDKERTAALHDAEAYLVDTAAVCPLFFETESYIKSGKLKNISSTYFGQRIFTETEQSDYHKYLPVEE